MVAHTGKTLRVSSCKLVNQPDPVQVEETESGLPVAVRLPQKQSIKLIDNYWRIDDEWWRSEAISRMYYTVILSSGMRLTLYKDLIRANWYRQLY